MFNVPLVGFLFLRLRLGREELTRSKLASGGVRNDAASRSRFPTNIASEFLDLMCVGVWAQKTMQSIWSRPGKLRPPMV